MHRPLFFEMLMAHSVDLSHFLPRYLKTIRRVIAQKDSQMRAALSGDDKQLTVWLLIVQQAEQHIESLASEIAKECLEIMTVSECLAVLEATKLYR